MTIHDKRKRLAAVISSRGNASPSSAPEALRHEPIAIVGLAAELPGCPDVRSFFAAVDSGRALLGPLPSERFALGAPSCAWGGFIADPFGFDEEFFGVLPRQADLLDPRQRLLLMSVYHALEDAGYAPRQLRESATGVFVAAEDNEYARWLARANVEPSELPPASASLLANHLSYFFDWRGPSEVIDTMCSGAAVALHRAVCALRSGELACAVVAAANVILSAEPYAALARGGQLSHEPLIHSFGAQASGFLRSEGVASLVLKTLSQAERDGDAIYALIRHSRVNYNGRGGSSIAAPHIATHAALIRACYDEAGLDVRELGYVEAQGMANPVADIAEWEAVNRALRGLAEAQGVTLSAGSCAVSTIKPQLGHMHACSALGALLRIVRSLQTRRMHGIAHFSAANPELELADQPCRLLVEDEPWSHRAGPRLAGLHSYGSGGNNAHLLIEEYVGRERQVEANGGAQIVPLSAHTPQQCRELLARLRAHVEREASLALHEVASTLQRGRDEFACRVALVARDRAQFMRAADALLQDGASASDAYASDAAVSAGANINGHSPAGAREPHALARAWVRGERVDWPSARAPRVSLPGYVFERSEHRVELEAPRQRRDASPRRTPRPEPAVHGALDTAAQGAGPLAWAWAERAVRQLIGSYLKKPAAGVPLRTPFSELGFDSTMVTSVVARLQSEHDLTVEPAALFELGTPLALIEHLSKEHSGMRASAPLRQAQRSPATAPSTRAEDAAIAIVGLAGRFPKAPTLADFWHNLREGIDCVSELPSARFELDDKFEPEPRAAIAAGKTYGRWAGVLEGAEDFDPLFFHMSPLEAEHMSPKERLFLQCAWHVLEDAGYTPEALAAQSVGVFVGATRSGPDPYYVSSFPIANRVSYQLNLRGPSMVVDTACSSSLVALHLACQQIANGECELAIAGGVHVLLGAEHLVALSRTSMLASDGRCRSFGSQATGMVPGEGVGAVLLKPLASALRDGDAIYGVIRGSAVNHGGKANGFTIPNPQAHREVIQAALEHASVRPDEIGYVEAHGTGTALGDPIEVRGLAEAFGPGQAAGACSLGSVKSNIGHLEAAAGISGLTKVLLQLQHGELAPSLHSASLNPNIDFARTPFAVQRERSAWLSQAGRRRIACVSSFGAGGSNAHVVVEEPPHVERVAQATQAAQCILLSARTEGQLREVAQRLLAHMRSAEHLALADVAYTLQVGRRAFDERLAFVARSHAELREKLQGFLRGDASAELFRGRAHGIAGSLATLLDDEDGAQMLSSWLSKGKFERVLELWVSGVGFAWHTLHGAPQPCPRRVRLPGYPFAQQRFPVPQTVAPARAPIGALHPLLQRNTSSLFEQSYESNLRGAEFFLRDHVVLGERVLPGVAYLEMAVQALLAATASEPDLTRNGVRLSRVRWLRPLKVQGEPRLATIKLRAAEDGELAYEVASSDPAGHDEPLLHGQGRLALIELGEPATLDLASLQRACTDVLEPAALYAAFAAFGIRYGDAHRGLSRISIGDGQLLAELALPACLQHDETPYLLHPALLDAALQATLALLVPPAALRALDAHGSTAAAALPFALDELELLCVPERELIAHIKLAGEPERGVRKLDVELADRAGRVAVRMRGFSLRSLEASEQTSDAPAAGMVTMVPVWSELGADELRARELAAMLDAATLIGDPAQQARLREVWPTAQLAQFDAASGELVLGPDEVRHFVWLAPPSAPAAALQSAIDGQEHGVIALFRFVKQLLAQGLAGKRLTLTVLTENAQPVSAGELVHATHASVHGFVGSLAKEYPHWTIRLFDLDQASAWPVRELRVLGGDQHGNALAYRAGSWFQQELLQLRESKATGRSFREGGVYLLIGGAGGLGKVLTRHLIVDYRAQVVWVGRRELDEGISSSLRELTDRAAPPPEYLRADATDREALSAVRRELEARFGRVDGVVHTAIVLKDQSLAKMSEAVFRAALSAKVDVSVRMAEVFADVPLLFFSSMQSIVKTPGQANYSAGCTFKDAFAHALAHTRTDIKTVNWGYWGSVGVVASADVQERMAKVGMGSIEPAEAMSALAQVLAAPLQQAVIMKTSRAVVPAGMNPAASVQVVAAIQAPLLDELVPALPGEALQIAQPSADEAREQTTMLELMLELTYGQLRELGAIADQPLTLEDALPRGRIVPAHRRWLEESLCLLTDHGYLARHGAAYAPTVAARRSLREVFAEFDERKARWLEHAQIRAQVVLLEVMMRSLPRMLRGELPPTEVMFPNSSLELVEGIHKGNALSDSFNGVLAELAVAFVRECVRRDPSARIRILEVGAGTGGTSAIVLPRLAPFADNIEEYRYTDLSHVFLQHAERTYVPAHPFVRPHLLDIQRPLAAAKLEPGSFDLVLAANVLHATKNMRETVRNVKAALRRHGLLLINEMSSNNLFSHLTFGLLDGWWLYEDVPLRLRGCPALSSASWQRLLREEGFARVVFPVEPHHDRGLQVIAAESDGVVRQRREAAQAVAAPRVAARANQPARSASYGVGLRPRAVSYLQNLTAQTLKLSPEEIDPSQPFERYGIDSIIVVQLTNALDETYGDISSTLLFEHQTIEAVADYLVAHKAERLREVVGADTAPERAIVDEPARRIPLVAKASALVPSKRDASSPDARAIAVIGLAGRYPEAPDVDAFWQNLRAGRNCVREIPRERFDYRPYFAEERGQWGTMYTKWGGFIDQADCFDAAFFQISPREAEGMDPQERVFVEAAYHALEDAGYAPAALGRTATVGVFAGVMNANYPTGTRYWSIANRVSYLLNLRGPSVALDTACSSSLTAIHLAIESLRSGSCDVAIAGGVNLVVAPFHYLCLTQMNMVSASDCNAAFGARADGFVDGEGVGAVVLKPLAQAQADGDHIYGILRGSAINHGGRTNGYTVPSPVGQAGLISAALRDAQVDARTVSYVEAHGTGTVLGDPLEVAGLTRAFEEHTQERGFCALGSVKSNIGHAESAAGIAGLTKVLLQMQHGELAPSLHAEPANPNIDFARTPFVINSALRPWPRPVVGEREQPRRAGISSFGAGGANAHLLVEEASGSKPRGALANDGTGAPALVVLSAKTRERLESYARELLAFVRAADQRDEWLLYDLAFTLQVGRDAMEHRLAIAARSLDQLALGLDAFSAGRSDAGAIYANAKEQRALLTSLFDDPRQAPVAEWLARGQHTKLLQLWAQGLAVDWALVRASCPAAAAARRIRAPRYPFAREHFWIDEAALATVRGKQASADVDSASQTIISQPRWIEAQGPHVDDAPLGERDVAVVVAGVQAALPRVVREQLERASVRVLTLLVQPARTPGAQLPALLSSLQRQLAALRLDEDAATSKLMVIYEQHAPSSPLAASVVAALKCLELENERLRVRAIGFDAQLNEALLRSTLGRELGASEPQVRYLGSDGRRHLLHYRALRDVERSELSFSPRGVVWITGGTGKLARALAEHLVRSYAVRVFLLGRASAEDARTRLAAELSSGIEYHCADVTERAAIEALLAQVEQRGLSLEGVVHTAAVLEDRSFFDNTADQLARVLAPKALGLELLDEVTRDQPLAFFAAFSSLSAITGNLGQSAYAAANAFLDGFLEQRQQEVAAGRRRGVSVAIDWPYWADGGMDIHPRLLAYFEQQFGLVPLAREAGLSAFTRLVRGVGGSALVTAVSRTSAQDRWLDQFFSRARADHVAPPASALAPNLQSLSGQLRELVARVTKQKLEDVHADSEFADLGVDSILLMGLAKELQRLFGLRLYVSELQSLTTVAALAAYVERELREQSSEQSEAVDTVEVVPAAAPAPSRAGLPTSALSWSRPTSAGKAKRTIIVLGTPRGGSTLLRVMLQNNGRLFAPPELYLLGHRDMRARRRELDAQGQGFLREGLLVALQSLRGGSSEEVEAFIAGHERAATSIADMYQQLRAQLPEDSYLVDKTPMYGRSLAAMQQAEDELDEPFYVYLYRHPLSVLSSLVNNRFHKMLGLEGEPWQIAEQIWTQWNENIRTFLAEIPLTRQLHVPYEAMVTEPELWLRQLCDRLSVPYDPRMITPYDELEGAMVKGSHEASLMIGDPNFLQHGAIEPQLAFAWKKHASRWSALSERTRALAASLGYTERGPNLAHWTESPDQPRLLPAQADFLARHADDPSWHIISTLRFEAPECALDEPRVRDNFAALLARHPVLAAPFPPASEHAESSPSLCDRLRWIDARAESDVQQARREDELREQLRARIDLRSGLVFAAALQRRSEHAYSLHLALHHLAGDGVSLGLIAQLLLGEAADHVRASAPQLDRNAYLRLLALYRVPSMMERMASDYAVEASTQPVSLRGGRPLARDVQQDERELRRDISWEELGADAGKLDWESVALALYRVLARDATGPVTIAHRLHRRNLLGNLRLVDDVGFYAGDVPIALKCAAIADAASARAQLRGRRRALLLGGVEYELLAQSGRLPTSDRCCRVRLNYQPFAPLLPSEFSLQSLESTLFAPPAHVRLYEIDVIVRQQLNVLTLLIRYNKQAYEEQFVQGCAREWLAALQQLLNGQAASGQGKARADLVHAASGESFAE